MTIEAHGILATLAMTPALRAMTDCEITCHWSFDESMPPVFVIG